MQVLGPQLRLEHERHRRHRRLGQLLQPGELLALRNGAPPDRQRGAQRGSRAVLGVLERVLECPLVGLGETVRVDAVAKDPIDTDRDFLREVMLERRGFVDRHLLGEGDDRDAGAAVVGQRAVERFGL
jgi:hypothetical protein